MRDILIEIGFDWNAGSLNRLVGDDLPLNQTLYPLQHAFVLNPGAGQGTPIWPTQLRGDDRIAFRIFDITRAVQPPFKSTSAAQPQREAGPTPTGFGAWFQHPNQPEDPCNIFVEGTEVPIRATAFTALGRIASHVYSATKERLLLPAWDLATKDHFTVEPPGPDELRRVFMTLLLTVRFQREERTYVLDPELYVEAIGG